MSRPTFYVSQDSSDSLDPDQNTPKIKVSSNENNTFEAQKCPKHRKHLRRHRLPAQKLDILRSPSVQEMDKKELKKVKKRQKSRRSHSITTQPTNELEVLKNWKLQNEHKNLSLKAENGDNTLPRTLSTSVLRIKHRRNFWERFAR